VLSPTRNTPHLLKPSLVIGVPLLLAVLLLLFARSAPRDLKAAEEGSLSVKTKTAKLRVKKQQRLAVGAEAHLFVGAGGCAAAACHGDVVTSEPSWKNSYSLWMTKDPHSKAYAALRSERSKRMLWLLDGAKEDEGAPADKPWATAAPHRDGRCLACHSVAPDAHTPLPESQLADGVACESCHGPARDWRTAHTTANWLARGSARYQQSGSCDEQQQKRTGAMWNTKDIASRANICIGCHVGGPDRDVNHDLLAAGHPRLNFEYAAFMANLPKHWDDRRDREILQSHPDSRAEKPGDYEARLWVVGQLAAAHAAATLLHQRTTRSSKDSATQTIEELQGGRVWRLGPIDPTWPEVSEYDCFACHHDIKTSSWRRELLYSPSEAGTPASKRNRRVGALPWGTWHFSIVRERLLRQPGLKVIETDDFTTRVRDAMEKPAVSHEDVTDSAAELAANLRCRAESVANRSIAQAAIDRALAEFNDLPPADSWDEAAQRYLALVALINSHARMATGEARLDYEQINARLESIREDLRFDSGYRSPGHIDVDRMQALRDKFSQLAPLLTR